MSHVPTYGQNLKRLRAGVTQEELARRAGKTRQANLPSYENDKKFPSPKLVRQHAAVLGVSTADLMAGVVTDFDRIRFPDLTDAQLEALLSGVAALSPQQREALARSGATAVAALQSPAATARDRAATIATPPTAAHTHPKKRRA